MGEQQTVSAEEEAFLRRPYAAFNARDLDTALSMMHPDVDWPNGLEGGREHGRDAVRAYWTRQFTLIDPQVEPVSFRKEPDGRVAVEVHQVVRDLGGAVLADQTVKHVWTIRAGLVEHMEIR
ncbi:MAG: nuclear transport factor 2 family protein [Dehalococcoidia bacterium]